MKWLSFVKNICVMLCVAMVTTNICAMVQDQDIEISSWLKDVHQGKKAQAFMKFVGETIAEKIKSPQNDFLRRHFYEIKEFEGSFTLSCDNKLHQPKFIYYSTLKAISTLKLDLDKEFGFNEQDLLKNIKNNHKSISYEYSNACNFPNFISAFNKILYRPGNVGKMGEQHYTGTGTMMCIKTLSTVMVSCWLSRLVRLNFYDIDPTIVCENENRRKLNQMINQSEFAESLSRYLQPTQNPMAYSYYGDIKQIWAPLFSVLVVYQQLLNNPELRDELGHNRFYYIAILGFLCGSGSFILNWLVDVFVSDELFSIGFVASVLSMWIYIITFTVKEMRKLNEGTFYLKDILCLLKKHEKDHIR